MGFDLVSFARELLAHQGHAELLARSARAAAQACSQPAFAIHLPPGQPWNDATVVGSGVLTQRLSLAQRSALFAVFRRVAVAPHAIHLERRPEIESIFAALLPQGSQHLTVVPLRNRSGRLSGAIVVGRKDERVLSSPELKPVEDIAALAGTAMEAATLEAVARRDQERLRLFSETAEESLWDWDIRRDDLWAGGDVELLFGARISVAKRLNWRQARIHPDDRDRVIASFEAALQGSHNSWNAEYRIHDEGAAVAHVREHVYFLREVDGRAYRAVGTVRDISALKSLLESETAARGAAERASVVKDEFLAMLGHELRNPLAPIVSILTLVKRRGAIDDKQLQILDRQTQHLIRLVNDLLDVSRIATGKVELTRQRLAVEPLVMRALEMMRPLFEQRRHHIDIQIAAPLEIDADEARMTQVMSNLLANAAKYSEPGSQVWISAREEADEVLIVVRDNGLGIAPELLPTIFDRFTQGPQSSNRAEGGLGLGLSIVKNIMQLHGGKVDIQSAGVGHGTMVTLRLPTASASGSTQADSLAAKLADWAPRDVLVVDDNQDAAETLALCLREAGNVVRVALDPHTGLRLFGERRPDVALLDIGLPGMDGYELVRRMRRLPGSAAVRYIAVTGYGLEADKTSASEAGFDAHLTKPVELEQLKLAINQ